MAQRNTENDGMIFSFALIGAVVFIVMFMFYALVCFAAIILSLIALCALNQELTIYKWTITPRDATIFLGCGIAGLIGLPVFVLFCTVLSHGQVPPHWWGYILLGGYSFGALGLSALIFDDEHKQAATKFLTLQSPPSAAPFALPSSPSGDPGGGSPAAPFRFASWDDEMPHASNRQTGSDGRALTTVQPVRPPAGNDGDCPNCTDNPGCPGHWTDEDIKRIVAKYMGDPS